MRFPCPHCAATLAAPDHLAGKASRCSKCRQPVTVPVDELEEVEGDEPPPDRSPPSTPRPWERPGRPSKVAVVCWIGFAVLAVVLPLWVAAMIEESSSFADPAVTLFRQCRGILIAGLVILGSYGIARAIDRLTQ